MELSGAVILAAGKGKRMKTETPKVLNRICGKPLIRHVLDGVSGLSSRIIIVIGYQGEQVKEEMGESFSYVLQEEQKGTGHAVMQAMPYLPEEGKVLIMCGDTPLFTRESLGDLAKESENGDAALLTAEVPHPRGYGRVIRDENNRVVSIVEESQANDKQRQIREINTGTYCVKAELLKKYLPQVKPDPHNGEYYLTEIISLLVRDNYNVIPCTLEDYRESLGVNDLKQLSEAEEVMRRRINRDLMLSGVRLMDPATTYIDAGVQVGSGTVIYPQTVIEGESIIGKNCTIGPSVFLKNVAMGNGVKVKYTEAEDAGADEDSVIGPFAYLRPGTSLGAGVKVGDFVEVKNSSLGESTKVPHLTYVGDADVGPEVNFGAGSIVVNYDGRKKHRTRVEEGAFIGCNSNLIAPITIGKGAYVAAGTTLNQDVPEYALAIGRAPQENKPDLAKRFIKKKD